ncbi:hypothetical protein C8F01DRAFT_1145328 [Mycena amicta]|nr:hypothetical protein C8F01DRAFT_1159359 [Mycena amicta]KAJ7059684.1 hypothetical protein C8F01DRAFT_1145328 [Mycena amicta]
MDLPHFPRELEREILEIAAEKWSHDVPKLLLVARRVHLWLEPFLYRSIYLHFPLGPDRKTDAQVALLRMTSSKPPSFLVRAVRQVSIDFMHGFVNPEVGLQFPPVLQHCTGMTCLAMNKTRDSVIGGKIFDVLNLVRLQRLAVFLGDLMPHPTPMDAHQPIFCSLTHLEVMDMEIDADPRCVPFLKSLPALTHLALRPQPYDTGVAITLVQPDGCTHLQILVLLLVPSPGLAWEVEEKWANVIGCSVDDPRVVVAPLSHFTDCISEQGHTYWHESEIFIQKRRLGLIPKDQYWTGKFLTVRDARLSGPLH